MALTDRGARWLTDHAVLVVTGCLLVTAALALPFVLRAPTATASQEPGGLVFEARDRAGERFATDIHRLAFVVEARGENLLARAPLLELKRNLDALRADETLGAKLATVSEPRSGRRIRGGMTLVDAVDGVLRSFGGEGLTGASDEQLARALDLLLQMRSPTEWGLAAGTRRTADGGWSAPAAVVAVLADNAALGGGGSTVTLGAGSLDKERFGRAVLRVLRGNQKRYRVWGLALDVNLTSAEQGRAAGPFIGMTIFAVLALVGVTFRSFWAVTLTGFSLGALIVWLRGLSNLIGLKNDQILSIIVPIAMISFGVDFAFHAIGRYREEQAGRTEGARRALRLGLAGVLGALMLALASDAVAFLSNTTSGIESLVQFGVGAALGLLASFVMLGLATPLALMLIEQRQGAAAAARYPLSWRLVGTGAALLAAGSATATVTVSVFVDPTTGVALLAGHLLLLVTLPAMLARRIGRAARAAQAEGETTSWIAAFIADLVGGLARRRWSVLLGVIVITGAAGWYASRIEVSFRVEDFFSADSDFVSGLQRFDRHLGGRSGEPALVYVEGDLAQPAALGALRAFVEEVRALSTERLARDGRGRVRLETGVLEVVSAVMGSPPARAAMAKARGVELADGDGDGIPDARAQLVALYRHAREAGVAAATADGGGLTARQVQSMLWQSDDGRSVATRIGLWLPGSASQDNIAQAHGALATPIARLTQKLRALQRDATVTLTGQPFVRQASLDAIFRAFWLSLPVALVLCLVLAAIAMRSVRFAVVSLVPIGLVVVWLYALMVLLGYTINIVTATIGAISIGIGIDFAVHFSMRYREELGRRGVRLEALRASGSGTGVALLASAVSSAVGFSILAFAPMPLFAAFGLLTAVMIMLALLATLAVLPSLLLLVTRDFAGHTPDSPTGASSAS